MKTLRFAVVCSLGLVALAAPARAQAPFVNMIDHLHLAAPDQAKGAEWYRAHFGAEPTPEGPDRMMLGTTRLIFQKTEMPKPSEGNGEQTNTMLDNGRRLAAVGLRGSRSSATPPTAFAGWTWRATRR